MTIRRPTFSKLPLAVTCPASMILPTSLEVREDDEESPARRGTLIHRYLQRVSDLAKKDPELSFEDVVDQAVSEGPDWIRPTLRSIDIDSIPTDLAAEVAFAWDWDKRTGRLLGQNLERNYGKLGPTEIAGATDLLGRRPGQVYVGDIKTGHRKLPRPGAYLQTLVAGLAASDVYGATSAVLELLYIDEDGRVWPVRDEVDAWDLAAAAELIAGAMRDAAEYERLYAQGHDVPIVYGPHCRDCDAMKNCNGPTALVRALPEQLGGLAGEQLPITNERAAEIFRRIQEAKGVLGLLEREIHRLALQEPIDLGDGEVLGEVEWKREELDGELALRQLEKLVGPAAAKGAAKISVSKDAARTVLAANAKKGERITTKANTGLFDRYLAELRAQRAVKVKSGTAVRVYKRKD